MKKRIFLFPLLCLCSLASCNGGTEEGEHEPPIESLALNRAIAELGKPYIWGGIGPDGYDAAGFVSYCVTGEHIRLGTCFVFMEYPIAETPAPGDICVNANNCGIFVSDDQMIFAAGPGDVVRYGTIEDTMIIVKYQSNN